MTAPTLEEQLQASIDLVNRRKENTMKPKVEFETNIWRELALKFPDGVNGENAYGPYVRFLTTTDETLFTPTIAAEKIRALKLNPGERFNMRKAEVMNGGPKPHIEWQVSRIDAPIQQRDGTLAIPKEPPVDVEAIAARIRAQLQKEAATASSAAAPATGATQPPVSSSLTSPNGSPFEHSGHAALLRDTTNMLIDVLANCKNYASKYQGAVAGEDVRTLLLSAYINLSKGPKC